MTIGTGLFWLGLFLAVGCYFLAMGLESLGDEIKRGLRDDD